MSSKQINLTQTIWKHNENATEISYSVHVFVIEPIS